MKKSWLVQLTLSLFLGMLLVAPWATSGPIQQQVGSNDWDLILNRWVARCTVLADNDAQVTAANRVEFLTGECGTSDVDAQLFASNGTTLDRVRTVAVGDGAGTGVLAQGTYAFNGTTWDRARTAASDEQAVTGIPASGNVLFNGTTWDRIRSATNNVDAPAEGATFNVGIPPAVLYAVGTGAAPPATGWVQLRNASAVNLTQTILGPGILPTVPASTWSVTNTPAAATQATASRAAGAAGVRHVATTITACLAAGATAQTPVVVNLRDGATGAGTVLRSWAISAPVNDSKCADLSGLAMLGTAATAMTIEFAAAGVAASQQTVTLTGFSTN